MAEGKGTDGEAVPPTPAAPEAPGLAGEKPAPADEGEDWATRFKYLFADFENFRKRAARDRESIARSTRAQVILELLPSYEAAQKAREAVTRLPPSDPIRKGIDLLVHEFLDFFEREHVTTVAQRGEPFRSDCHEAVAEAPPRDRLGEGMVLEVVQQGYRIDSTLLRPAKVVVARVPPAAAPSAAATEAAGEPDTTDP